MVTRKSGAEGESSGADGEKNVKQDTDKQADKRVCGMVRPIADMGDYGAKHWIDVHNIVAEAADDAGFRLRLVSESDSVGIILNDIVSNLYKDPIVICDVSGRNPNVMFEVGMRIAFEKPTIIITDDDTPFSFDISPLKHIQYPRSLRYGDMQAFKKAVSVAITATLQNSSSSSRGYLQQFGDIQVTSLGTQTVGLQDLADEVKELRRSVQSAYRSSASNRSDASLPKLARDAWWSSIDLRNRSAILGAGLFLRIKSEAIEYFMDDISRAEGLSVLNVSNVLGGASMVQMRNNSNLSTDAILALARNYDKEASLIETSG